MAGQVQIVVERPGLSMGGQPQPSAMSPTGDLFVMPQPHQRFMDTFDTAVLDTTNKWTATAAGGGVIPTASIGGCLLSSGTTLNGYSLLQSKITPNGRSGFTPSDPGFQLIKDALIFESPLLATGYRFFGSATVQTTPVIGNAIIEAMGWEVTTAAQLVPVVYQTGTRLAAVFGAAPGLPTLMPSFSAFVNNFNPNAHKYYRWFKGDEAWWAIDDPTNFVAYFNSGAGGPNANQLPISYLAISNGGTAVTINIAGISVADTADNSGSLLLNNGVSYDEMRSNMDANTALVTLTAQGTGTVNSPDQLNVNGKGVIVYINTTVAGGGSYTVAIQGKDQVSGNYYTLTAPGATPVVAISGAIATTGIQELTVYPGTVSFASTTTAGGAVNMPLPRTWRVQVVATTGPITATIGSCVIN